MKTKLVRPVLIESKEHTNIFKDHSGLFYSSLKPQTGHSINSSVIGYKLILISLEDETIEVGDMFVFINKHPKSDGKPRLDRCDSIHSNGSIQPFDSGCLCIREWPRKFCHKVIATQPQLSPELINKLVAEYNNGGMQDFEIGLEEYDHDEEWSEISGAYETFKIRIKLTNGFVTVVDTVFGISNNPNINGVDYENTPIPDYPIIYIEEEVKALINKAIFDTVGNPMLITSELKINDSWFNESKKK